MATLDWLLGIRLKNINIKFKIIIIVVVMPDNSVHNLFFQKDNLKTSRIDISII